jgi:chorismate-pyruvate lyase
MLRSGMRSTWPIAVLALLLPPACGSTTAAQQRATRLHPPAAGWSSDFIGRLEALALLQTLNAELLSHDSATLTLDRWCSAHRLASPAKVVAVRDRAVTKPATPEVRKILAVGDDEPVRYRRVRLTCGAHVLSEADNWYVPSRLTEDMNRQLDTSDIAFGRAVQALQFHRRTLSARLLWSPLPDGWQVNAIILPAPTTPALQIPHEVLQHRAVLTLPDGTAFSHVVETYTEAVLAFPQPTVQRAGRDRSGCGAPSGRAQGSP